MLKRLCAVVGCVFALSGHAQEQLTYRVSDLVAGISMLQSWDLKWKYLEDEEGKTDDKLFIVTKNQIKGNEKRETQEYAPWHTDTRLSGGAFYMRQVIAEPWVINHGGETFGYSQMRDARDDHVIDNWPLFFEVHPLQEGFLSITRIIYSERRVAIITREYEEGMYAFPKHEEQEILEDGKTVAHVIFEVIP